MAVVSSCRESRDPGERSPGKIQLTTVKPPLQGTALAISIVNDTMKYRKRYYEVS